jgi:hypothetical protein
MKGECEKWCVSRNCWIFCLIIVIYGVVSVVHITKSDNGNTHSIRKKLSIGVDPAYEDKK